MVIPPKHEHGYASVSSRDNVDFDFSAARHQTEAEINADYKLLRTSNWIAAVATAVIALALSYLAIQLRKQTQLLTDQLAKSSEVLLRAGEETNRLEQQPWVGVAGAVAQQLTVTGGHSLSRFKIRARPPLLMSISREA